MLDGRQWHEGHAIKDRLHPAGMICVCKEVDKIKRMRVRNPIPAKIHLPYNDVVCTVALIDSGALQGNYVARTLAEELLTKGSVAKQRAGMVCSYSGKDCSPLSQSLTLTISLSKINLSKDNQINDKILSSFTKRIKIDCAIIDMEHPVIIGLPSIDQYGLLELLKVHGKSFEILDGEDEKYMLLCQEVGSQRKNDMQASLLDIVHVPPCDERKTLMPSTVHSDPAISDFADAQSQRVANSGTSAIRSDECDGSGVDVTTLPEKGTPEEGGLASLTETYDVPEGTMYTKAQVMGIDPGELTEEEITVEGFDYTLDEGQSLEPIEQWLEESYVGTPEQKDSLRALCHEFLPIFSANVGSQAALVMPMTIKIDQAKWQINANRGSPRVFNQLKEAELLKQVTLYEKLGVIERTQAVYHSQVHLTPKPSGGYRMCIDYRNFNNACEGMGWPLPNIKAMILRIGARKPKFFAKMDMPAGYHQAPLSMECREGTAFITPFGKFVWNRVPMGLKGATGFFQDMMTRTLGDLVQNGLEVYLDDILVYAQSEEELHATLRQVFTRLQRVGIRLNPKKCQFGLRKVEFVGHTIDEHHIEFSDEKKDSVMAVVLPRTERELRAFIGLANYFRDNVRDFAKYTHTLVDLITGDGPHKPVIWTEETKHCFEKIKEIIRDSPARYHRIDTAPMTLQTDASDYGFGAYLYQTVEDSEQPLAFLSKTFSKVQKRWSTPEKEGYAIYFALMKWEYLLMGPHFTIRTDHRNLTFVSTSGSAKVLRWKLAIQEYDFDIYHIPGKDNMVADQLSRLLPMEDQEEELLFAMTQLPIPDEHYAKIAKCHNGTIGHHGVERTIALLDDAKLSWKGRREHVKKFVKECAICQKNDDRRIATGTHPFTTSSYRPMERLNIDSIGPLEVSNGYEHVMVVLDCFTRFVELYALKGVGGEEARECIFNFATRYGIPSVILTDGGTQFVNQYVQELTESMGTELVTTTPYSKEENSMVERANKEVGRHLRNLLLEQGQIANWPEKLLQVQRIVNGTIHEPLGVSPATMVMGSVVDFKKGILTPLPKGSAEDIPMSEWLKERLDSQAQLHKSAADSLEKKDKQNMSKRQREVTQYPVGSEVLVSRPPSRLNGGVHKFKPKHKGPVQVVGLKKDQYILQEHNHDRGTQKAHVSRLRPFHYDPTRTDPAKVALLDNEEFMVEKVLRHRGAKIQRNMTTKTNLQFEVKWEGYPETTWEGWQNMSGNAATHKYLRSIDAAYLIPRRFRQDQTLALSERDT